MQIIPVIDLKGGQVVLARQGHRHSYQALSTALCPSSKIEHVIDAYLSIWPFTHIYIADLDALMGTGDNDAVINPLFARYPQLNFMIDCGSFTTRYHPAQITQYMTIIGTESINKTTLINIRQQTERFILSLDFSTTHKPIGDPLLYASNKLWPKDLIIMTLGRVGKNQGADLTKLKHYCHTYPEHNFIAAGGIRHINDLMQLKTLGIKQALVASALHNKTLTTHDIQILNKH